MVKDSAMFWAVDMWPLTDSNASKSAQEVAHELKDSLTDSFTVYCFNIE